jgi:hypothetical protein
VLSWFEEKEAAHQSPRYSVTRASCLFCLASLSQALIVSFIQKGREIRALPSLAFYNTLHPYSYLYVPTCIQKIIRESVRCVPLPGQNEKEERRAFIYRRI